MEICNLLEVSLDFDASLRNEFKQDVKKGLNAKSKYLLSKYLYDDKGSFLFKEITQLDEYYLTRTELSIIHSIKKELPFLIKTNPLDIIELGVGDGHKSSEVVKAFIDNGHDISFYPIDISSKAFDLLENNISAFKHCHIKGILADYFKGIQYANMISKRNKLILLLGSNIGNFSNDNANIFLNEIRDNLNPGDYLLIGFDLKKDLKMLQRAYDDHQGVTKTFNLNLLKRINQELGANFNLDKFIHHALYNPSIGAMESYLLSLAPQKVKIEALNTTIDFDGYEPIHVEYSFKYTVNQIEKMADDTNFSLIRHFTDKNNYFVDSLWQVTTDR